MSETTLPLTNADQDEQLKVMGVRALIDGWHPSWVRVYTDWVRGTGYYEGESPKDTQHRLDLYEKSIGKGVRAQRQSGSADLTLPASKYSKGYKRYD